MAGDVDNPMSMVELPSFSPPEIGLDLFREIARASDVMMALAWMWSKDPASPACPKLQISANSH